MTLIVEDTGTGMDDEEQTRIFTAFERLPNAIAEEGVGLGLSIVKGLVGLLDGRIEVASRKGVGSRFTVCLPLAVAEEAMAEAAGAGFPYGPIRYWYWTMTPFCWRQSGKCLRITGWLARYVRTRVI